MRASGVAAGCESALEHAFENGHGAEDGKRWGKLGVGGEVHHRGHDMDVRVNEAGQDGATAEVDRLAIGCQAGGMGRGNDVADETIFDEEVTVAWLGPCGVDERSV